VRPRKARLAAGLIRGKKVTEAVEQLRFANSKGSRLLIRTLHSAVANAELQGDLRKESLIVSEVRVDEGPRLKRAKPRSRGSRHPIVKKTSHFTVAVAAE